MYEYNGKQHATHVTSSWRLQIRNAANVVGVPGGGVVVAPAQWLQVARGAPASDIRDGA